MAVANVVARRPDVARGLLDELLHGLLRRIEALGLELVELRRVPPDRPADP